MVKDFNNFQDRSGNFLTSTPLAKSLFFARGSGWRRHRQIVSPTFTTAKLKQIATLVDISAQSLSRYLGQSARQGAVVPMKEICGQYTCEIIARTAFGFKVDCIGVDDEFYNNAKNLLYLSRKTISQLLRLIPFIPQLCVKVFKLQIYDRVNLKSHRYFDTVLKSAIKERRIHRQSGIRKATPDFLDLLLKTNEASQSGQVNRDEVDVADSTTDAEGQPVEGLTDEEILGHSMLVIFAGLESTASTLHVCLYELALNPDIQERVYQEMQEVLKSDCPSYEELSKLTYMEQVINETLRLYPPLLSINRLAKESVTYNGITIPKGATVMIPLFHILTDPNIYPDPNQFDPDRFSPEEREKRHPLAFMPFGHGPRMCLGMRLAYLELKQGLVQVLRKLRVVLNEDTTPRKGEGKIKTIALEILVMERPIRLAFQVREQTVTGVPE
ncbi:unnamed protein product [Candidula unifasciata]|uniref:Cytochrome P450 n=1 Tax=Candidula unifasciata TaxID=100452 RepID=A0A8S3YT14_9EUPU|nr:unnamed protein product [Candidula unifasciata]